MAKNLLIVESPAKAKTIEKFLGTDFQVKSCYGHIRDLEKDGMGIDLANQYAPRYIVPEDKKQVVTELKKLAKSSEEVWLASDEDREGESISWHLAEILNLDPTTTKRIVFHEITKTAIKAAVDKPRTIDMNLVHAQQARRILDRLVGFELSPVLWRKIGMRGGLSAGRVQSVAVRLIVEREREINQFVAVSTFKVEAYFTAQDTTGKIVTFKAEGTKQNTVEAAERFLQSCVGAQYCVEDVQIKPAKRNPPAPFTTSTLQQEASQKLGSSVSRTMLMAQKLYESGKITYMRTDSTNLSDMAMAAIQKEISYAYGDTYYQHRIFKTKNASAQEAHEAIRPTDMSAHTIDDADTKKLYELIWKRTTASQMSEAVFEKTVAKINISTNKATLTATGEVLIFDGFLKVYRETKSEEDLQDEEADGMLPPLCVSQSLPLQKLIATERFNKPAPRYTEASLVKKLEELGIGRPSTYAPTISTIVKRNYVEKRDKEGAERVYRIVALKDKDVATDNAKEIFGTEKNKMFPTDLGILVTDFLKLHFEKVMDYSFTARIEESFDEIADGKMQWNKMIDDFYLPFHSSIEYTLENAARVSGERALGNDPVSGKKIITRVGKFGPMVQIGNTEDEEKPRFAGLRKNQSIETITLEEALDLFKLPRDLGTFEDEDVVVNIGRFGPYVLHNKAFYSLSKEMDPYAVSLAEASILIAEKREEKRNNTLQTFEAENIQILKGRFGVYVKQGKDNFKLTKEQKENAATLTLDEILSIIEMQRTASPKKFTPSKMATKDRVKTTPKKKVATKKVVSKKKLSRKKAYQQ